MKLAFTGIIVSCFFVTIVNASTFYRCQVDGRTTITNVPCAGQVFFETREIQTAPSTLSRSDLPEYCPHQYFSNPLPEFANFESLSNLIKSYGKLAVFRVTYRLASSMVTIRVGEEFTQFMGPPDEKYIDECTIMYDLIKLRLSPENIEKTVRNEDERRKEEELRKKEEIRIAQEEKKRKEEETRRIALEERRQKYNEEERLRRFLEYNNKKIKPCHEACAMLYNPGSHDYQTCFFICSN